MDLNEDEVPPSGSRRDAGKDSLNKSHAARLKSPPIYGEIQQAQKRHERNQDHQVSHQRRESGSYRREHSDDQTICHVVQLTSRAHISKQSGVFSTNSFDHGRVDHGRKGSVGSSATKKHLLRGEKTISDLKVRRAGNLPEFDRTKAASSCCI